MKFVLIFLKNQNSLVYHVYSVDNIVTLTVENIIDLSNCKVTKTGYDIYGLKIENHDSNGELVECGICKKSVAAARFAPHLEKCMGLGRGARNKRSRKSDVKLPTAPSSASDLDDFSNNLGDDNLPPLLLGDDPYSMKRNYNDGINDLDR